MSATTSPWGSSSGRASVPGSMSRASVPGSGRAGAGAPRAYGNAGGRGPGGYDNWPPRGQGAGPRGPVGPPRGPGGGGNRSGAPYRGKRKPQWRRIALVAGAVVLVGALVTG